ncbi:RND family transporter [Zavarzinia sp.]|uniref:efflux RND transporter permease subunit n=1 Tax=Zavarzinia sp. TaxID=2027920 RepID=UPI0035634E7E
MIDIFSRAVVRHRFPVLIAMAVVTVVMGWFALHVQIKTRFTDLLPRNHPYVQVDQDYKASFGSSNLVTIMVSADQGEIFTPEILGNIRDITLALRTIEGVNQFGITSLASKKLKEIRSSTYEIETRPLMWPDVPRSADAVAALRAAVLNNGLVYGQYVARDLKSALITVDFIDRLVDYDTAFAQINQVIDAHRLPGVTYRVVGDPMLYGWIGANLGETGLVFLLSVAVLGIILFLCSRTWYGTVLPLLSGLLSAVWALGFAELIGFNFDPLIVVLAFLVSARSVSHTVQLIMRFEDEVDRGRTNARANAVVSVRSQFVPGTLGVVVDAGAIILVAMTPIPLLEKVAVIGTFWVCTIVVTAFVVAPVLLSYVRRPGHVLLGLDVNHLFEGLLRISATVASSRWRIGIFASTAVVVGAAGFYALGLKIGDAQAGSPILWPDSTFNRDSAAVNATFPGSDRMFIVIDGGSQDAMKDPALLAYMQDLQRYIEAQPQVGATVSVADLLPKVMRTLHENNPRYEQIGPDAATNGELLYMYLQGSDPDDLDQFVDRTAAAGAITIYFRDRQGDTIRTAVARIKDFVAHHPPPLGRVLLAGGLIGQIAAVNEVILADQIISIAAALLVVILASAFAYRSMGSGLLFMVPVVIANVITFAFMALAGIGMNVNTLPVAALGIGLGVDYAFYVVDRIKEEVESGLPLGEAIRISLMTAGKAVFVTALTMSVGVCVWMLSALRFQADMALLMSLWLFVSALSALVLLPSLVAFFKPRFVIGHSA